MAHEAPDAAATPVAAQIGTCWWWLPLASGVVSVGVVQRHHVRGWADQAKARYGLPELVRRLVRETAEGPVDARFATEEGVDLDGFDGTVRAAVGSRWVPSGCSVWEVSTERSVGSKADDDYDARDAAPPGWSMSDTAYVAVSLRAWRDRDEWAERRTGENRWREVRALGLDDVMSWLGDAPNTELWLADQLTLHPEELELGSRWWEQRQRGTGGLFDRRVALAGRSNAADELLRRIAAGSGPIVVEAAAVDEALEFIAAAGEAPGGPADDEGLLDRMVFVSGRHALQRLLTEQGPPLLVVVTDPDLGSVVGLSRHTVVIAVQAQGAAVAARRARDGTRDCVVVPRLDARAVAEALDNEAARARGISLRRAQHLGAVGRCSATSLRRELSVQATEQTPRWAQVSSAAHPAARQAKAAALLAGQWSAGSPDAAVVSGDRKALVRLAGDDIGYETLESEFGALTGSDPMLSRSGSAWQLVNPIEAWLLLADQLLTADALYRFIGVATEVLQERDPFDRLSGDEHLEPHPRAGRRRYSRALRRGMARTLALLSVHSSNVALVNNQDPADLATYCVRQLFEPDDDGGTAVAARVRRLAGLGEVMPLLAEAAPDEFVAAVDQTLQPHPEAARLWFTDSWDDLSVAGSSSPHMHLLFALEALAWLPECLAFVADLLVRLEVLDPGGRLAHRPAATFAAIFSYWAPQTGIDHRDRLDVLRGLHDRLLSSGTDSGSVRALARLLAALIPRGASVIIPSTPPQIREYQLPPERIAGEAVADYLGEVVELLVGVTEHRVREHRDPAAILDLIEPAAGVTTATSLPPSSRDRLWALFEEAASILGGDELPAVGQRLEGLVRFHSSHPDADWALPADETSRLDRLTHRIAGDRPVPSDPVEANLWLFAEYHPELGDGIEPRDDLAAYEQTLRTRRTAAVGEIVRAEGLGGLYRLAARADADGGAAPVGVIGVALQELESGPGDGADIGQPLPVDGIETRMLEALDLPVGDAAVSPQQRHQGVIAGGYFFARLRRTRRGGGDGWDWLGELLHREGVTAAQQARLLELTDDGPRAWREAEALGPEALTAYWRLMQWPRLGNASDHLEEISQGLLGVGRAVDVVYLLASQHEPPFLEPHRAELAADALEALARTGAAQSASVVEAWHITRLLDFLARHFPVTEDNLDEPLLQRLTRLEMALAELRRPGEPAPLIHDRMSLDPRSFVEVVCLVHPRADTRPQDLTPHDDATPGPPAQPRVSHMAAYRILTSWQRPPGSDSSGAIDYDRMKVWIHEAQQLLDVEDRRDVGDKCIGRALSTAPPDSTDGIAPPIPIRRLLEERPTPELERGLGLGLLMGPSDLICGRVGRLVAESQQAHQQAQRHAAAIAARWPRTAQLLRDAASGHRQLARSWPDGLDPID